MQDPFWRVEEEFLRLRGQFAVGQLSAEEFDAALQNLQVQDAEGRVWMMGANTGRWYYSTSPQWVEADPAPEAAIGNEPESVQHVVLANDETIALAPLPADHTTTDLVP